MSNQRPALSSNLLGRLERLLGTHSAVWPHIAVIGPAVIVLTMSTYTSFRRPLWRDEVATWLFAGMTPAELDAATRHVDVVLYPYYFVIHMITDASSDPFTLRALSIAAGVVTVLLVGYLALRWWGALGALTTGLVLVTNTLFLEITATARPYALATALTALAFSLIDRALSPGRHYATWASVAIAMLALGLTHLVSALALVAAMVLVLGCAKEKRIAWLLSCACAVLGTVPLAIQAVAQRGQVSWIPEPTVRSAVGSLGSLVVYEKDGYLGVLQAASVTSLILAAAVSTTLLVLGRTRASFSRSRPRQMLFAGTALALPWLILLIESLIFTPYLRTMYLSTSLIGLALFLAGTLTTSIDRGRRGRVRLMASETNGKRLPRLLSLLGVAAVLSALILPVPTTISRLTAPWWTDDFPGLASYFQHTSKKGDVFILVQLGSETGVNAGIARSLGDSGLGTDARAQTTSNTQPTVSLRRVVSTQPFFSVPTGGLRNGQPAGILFTRGAIAAAEPSLRQAGLSCPNVERSPKTLKYGLLRFAPQACHGLHAPKIMDAP